MYSTVTVLSVLLGILANEVLGADPNAHTSSNYISTQAAIIAGIGATAFIAVLAVGLFMYRRRRAQQPVPTTQRISSLASNPPQTRKRTSSMLLRHAIQKNHTMIAAGGSSMKRNNRRKPAPSAIMVEVPPASLTVDMGVQNQHLDVQRSVGLHVPPSPAYDFHGRSGDLPVTPRTPCMSYIAPSNADADRMV
jgi:hypothetical protein